MAEKPEIWTIRRVLDWTRGYLAEKGIENARLETEWLLCAALGLDRVGLYVNFDKPLNQEELVACRGLVARRAKREPLQYILGTQEFCGLDFTVTPSVLIPRHDTEVIVEEALRRAPQAATILDIGVGSGCIAVVLARQFPHAQVWGVEQSPDAIALAQRNVERHGARVTLFEGSLFEPFGDQRFDLIVSNPPYIPTADLEALQPEVREYEPRAALDGGADGLDFYRIIVPVAPEHLNPGGWLILEVGIGQAEAVLAFMAQAGFGDCFTAKDPNSIDRVVGGRVS